MQSRTAMKRANRTGFFFCVADGFNLWLFGANKFYSGNIMFVLATVVEVIVKKKQLIFSVLPSMPLLHEIFNYVYWPTDRFPCRRIQP